jgi:hypothetical protein
MTRITPSLFGECDAASTWKEKDMQNSSLVAAIEKSAIAGEQAGFSVEQMIQIL